MLLNKIDSYGKPGWIAVIVASFWLAWPIGLVVLAYLAGSGRLQAWRGEAEAWRHGMGSPGTWFNLRTGQPGKWTGARQGSETSSSGNQAFDAYREATLRGLEEEQREFQAFLERLRKARDKAEFDAFMNEQRQRPSNTEPLTVATPV